MQAHRVTDYLLERVRKTQHNNEDFFLALIALLKKAEKVEFQSVPFVVGEPIPKLELYEKEWFSEGLIPTPGEVVWYEVKIPDKTRSDSIHYGLLVYDTSEFINENKTIPADITGIKKSWKMFYFILNGVGKEKIGLSPIMIEWFITDGKYGQIRSDIPHFDFALAEQQTGDSKEKLIEETVNRQVIFFYLTLMINSKSTRINQIVPSSVLNKKCIKNNRTPMDGYRTVTIVDRELLKGQNGGSGSPKRLHSCRSHLRHFEAQTENSKWMENKEWKGKTGWWVTVIPRHFRGQRELGTIEHDYIVQ